MGWCRRGLLVAAAVAGSVGVSTTARATDAACFDAYEQTQRLRNSSRVSDARDQAVICAASTCPGSLQKDCVKWRDELTKNLATVIFSAHDEAGQQVTNAAVYVDDRKVADSLDGKPVTLDPGPHKVRWESGDRKVETIVQLTAGETSRHIDGAFAPATPPPPPPATEHHKIPTVSLVLGGVAGVGLISFISFAAAGRVEQGCSPKCQSGQISTLRAEYAVADVSWITGLAALGAGITIWLILPSPAAPPAAGPPPADAPTKAATLHLQTIPLPGGGGVGLGGEF